MKLRFTCYYLLLMIGISACQQQTEQSQPKNKESIIESNGTEYRATSDSNFTSNAETDYDPTKEMAAPSGNDIEAQKLVESIGFASTEQVFQLPSDPSETRKQHHTCNQFSAIDNSNQGISTDDAGYCQKISNRLASVSMQACSSAKLIPSGCESVSGVPLMIKEFPPLTGKMPLGRVLVIGGTHGDELTSVSVVFRWIDKLEKYHSGLFHWHIMPVMNPDGLLKRAAERTNENGVDLNRNLPSTDWQQNALAYWKQKNGEDPRKYPGTEPNSEPETQWLVDEIAHFKPDAIISVHAPYGVVDFDSHQLHTAPKSLGKLHLNLLGTYPGSLGNYAGINRNIPVITLELPHAWEMPSQNDTDRIWQDIVGWLRTNVANQTAVLAE